MTIQAAGSPTILIITVQYGNFGDTKTFVESLARARHPKGLELIVVDNSREESPGLASLADASPFPVRVIKPERNLYYWGGAARALELVSQANKSYDWTIICNNDVMIDDRSFFERLMSLDPDRLPIIGPSIQDPATQTDQNPLLSGVPRGLRRLRWQVFDAHYAIAKAMVFGAKVTRPLGRRRMGASARARRIYAPHGAFVILSRAFFAKGGSLDTTLSMYAEELTLAATAERLQLPVWYRPDLKVIHNAHSTTGASLTREKYQMERAARRRFFALRDGRVPHS